MTERTETAGAAAIDRAGLLRLLGEGWTENQLLTVDVTASTNTLVREAFPGSGGERLLAVAGTQTMGRGRRGRSFYSPAGCSIYMSLGVKPRLPVQACPMLTLAAAMAVYDALETRAEGCRIKWPNDIVIGGRKVCGILTELSMLPGSDPLVIIGIGINVNTPSFPPEIREVAASLYTETGRTWAREPIIAEVWRAFEVYGEGLRRQGDLRDLREAYNRRLVSAGRTVCIEEDGVRYQALAEGIDDSGALQLLLPDGSRKSVFSGEVSVRGVLGYV